MRATIAFVLVTVFTCCGLLAADDCPPVDQCNDVFFDLDRAIRVGDKVIIHRRKDGKIGGIDKIESFDNLPLYAKQVCEANCSFAATIKDLCETCGGGTRPGEGMWQVSSYGRTLWVPYDKDSLLLDHEGYNIVYVDFHGARYEAEIDPHAVNQTAVITMPCWPDRLTASLVAFGGWRTTATKVGK